MLGNWKMTCFEYNIIQDIEIRELTPNGYIKTIYSNYGDSVTYYYNKDGLLINEKADIKIEDGRDYKGIVNVEYAERPILFDTSTMIWYQTEIIKLRGKNVEYLDTIMMQSNTIHSLENVSNNRLAEIGNLRNQLSSLNPSI